MEKKSTRQRFTKSEDEIIISLVKIYGDHNWEEIVKRLPKRTTRQCRERWLYHLNPSLNSLPWTQEEDQLLLKLHKKYGSRWTQLSHYFNGRPNCSLKNRFFVLNYNLSKIDLNSRKSTNNAKNNNNFDEPNDNDDVESSSDDVIQNSSHLSACDFAINHRLSISSLLV